MRGSCEPHAAVVADRSRIDKVLAIAGYDLPRHICVFAGENRTPVGNCSRCDKCLNTMATIAACGESERFRTFDWSVPPHTLIDRLCATRFVRTYGELLDRDLPPPLAAAIRNLLRRNAVPARLRPVWAWWRG